MGPISYARDVQTPFQAAIAGYQLGTTIRDDQAQQAQLQTAQQQQQRQQQALQALLANPNAGAQDYAAATLLVPGMKDQFKQAWDMKTTSQQQSGVRDLSQYYAAVVNGRPEIAVEQMNARADAMERSGVPKREVDALRAQAQSLDAHPEFGRALIGMLLHSVGGDKVIDSVSKLGAEQRAAEQAPADLAIKNATAGIKGVEAANAPTKTALENTKAGEDIETARAQREIAALNTQIGQANSETQRGELVLKRDEWAQKLAQVQQGKGEGAQSQLDSVNQSLGTIDSLINHPGLHGRTLGISGLGGAGDIAGAQLGMIPGTNAKDFRAVLETAKSQQFLTAASALKGMGALSDAEGARIERAVASLDPNQSEGQLKNALGVIRSTLVRAQAKVVASGALPTTGGAFVMRHPKFGNVGEGEINKMLAAWPGSTREDVLNYLESTKNSSTGASQIPR